LIFVKTYETKPIKKIKQHLVKYKKATTEFFELWKYTLFVTFRKIDQKILSSAKEKK